MKFPGAIDINKAIKTLSFSYKYSLERKYAGKTISVEMNEFRMSEIEKKSWIFVVAIINGVKMIGYKGGYCGNLASMKYVPDSIIFCVITVYNDSSNIICGE